MHGHRAQLLIERYLLNRLHARDQRARQISQRQQIHKQRNAQENDKQQQFSSDMHGMLRLVGDQSPALPRRTEVFAHPGSPEP